MPSFTVKIEDVGGLLGEAQVSADDHDGALAAGLDQLGGPLRGQDEGTVTITISDAD